MKILVEIRDDKAAYLVEALKGMKYIKTTTISPAKALLLKEMKEAVAELNLIKQGKKKARAAKNFLDGL